MFSSKFNFISAWFPLRVGAQAAFICLYVFGFYNSYAMTIKGGGISTELYRYSPFGLEAQYPYDWIVEGISDRTKIQMDSHLSSCLDLKSKLKEAITCEEAYFHNTQSPVSSVKILFVFSPQMESQESLLDAAKRWSPQVIEWIPNERTAYSVGFTSKMVTGGTPGKFLFKDIYFPSKGLGVFISGVGYDSHNGLYGVNFIRDSISRIGEDLTLKSFRPEKLEIEAGDWICYFFTIASRRKSTQPPQISRFEFGWDPAPVTRTVRVTKVSPGSEETQFQACSSTSPRMHPSGADAVSIDFLSDSGSELLCKSRPRHQSSPSQDELVCSHSKYALWSGANSAQSKVVSGKFTKLLNPSPQNTGPTIHSLTLTQDKSEIILKASSPLGLGSVHAFVSEKHGVFFSGSDWEGSGNVSGSASWLTPGNKDAKLNGELRIPTASFATQGPLVLRSLRVLDTAGNKTDIFLPLSKKTPVYLMKRDGDGLSEFGRAIEWLALEVKP